MSEEYFGLGDECAVNPFLSSGAAGLANYGSEVTFRETEAFCVVTYLVLLTAMLVDELDEAVEDGLLA